VKAFIVVRKTELDTFAGLETSMTSKCIAVKSQNESLIFHPLEGKLMDVICMLLDKEIPYQLNFNSETTSVKPV